MRTLVIGMLLATAMVSAEDSPLVALAKRSNRAKSKIPVITNQSVAHSKGRFSQSSGDAVTPVTVAAPSPAAPTPVAAATPVAAKPAPAVNPRITMPGEVGSGAYGASTARIIEPQSSARNIDPTGVRATAPTAATQPMGPTIVQPVTPQSSARNIAPVAAPIQGLEKKQQ
ncbi:MAG TPA: hypothetical protein VM733_01485 [Thermoanaerobaculia bacterium]|nr:hypothetical protein [Thermoanaerobaculia bacterium]